MNAIQFLKQTRSVTDADIKFVETYIKPQMSGAAYDAVESTQLRVSNPLTGFVDTTNPIVAMLVAFTQELAYSDFSVAAMKRWNVPKGKAVQLYDRARYLVLKLDSNIYSNVID